MGLEKQITDCGNYQETATCNRYNPISRAFISGLSEFSDFSIAGSAAFLGNSGMRKRQVLDQLVNNIVQEKEITLNENSTNRGGTLYTLGASYDFKKVKVNVQGIHSSLNFDEENTNFMQAISIGLEKKIYKGDWAMTYYTALKLLKTSFTNSLYVGTSGYVINSGVKLSR